MESSASSHNTYGVTFCTKYEQKVSTHVDQQFKQNTHQKENLFPHTAYKYNHA